MDLNLKKKSTLSIQLASPATSGNYEIINQAGGCSGQEGKDKCGV